MRILRLNGVNADIDDTTSIGIDFQAYDISDPGNRKASVSNNISLPKTDKNMSLLGWPGNPHSISQVIYNTITCDYYIDSVKLINNGSFRVTEVSDRINGIMSEKATFWDELKNYLWPDFLFDYIQWMQDENSLPSATTPFTGTFPDFIDPYIDSEEGIVLPFFIGNLALFDPAGGTSYVEDTTNIYIKYQDGTMDSPALGGHFCIYVKSIFQFLEQKYGVDFMTSDSTPGNIWLDEIAPKFCIPARTLSVHYVKSGVTVTGFYFNIETTAQFLPGTGTVDKESKSMYDKMKAFFQHFNMIISQEGESKYMLARFDDISEANEVDFSERLTGQPVFTPIIDKYNQVNYIKFGKIFKGGDPLLLAKKITCLNKNIDAGGNDSTLISIGSFLPTFISVGGNNVPDLRDAETFGEYIFFIPSGNSSVIIHIIEEGISVSASKVMKIANLYNLDGEYNTLQSMMSSPVKYTIKKWLTLNEVNKLKYFKRYWIKSLNGHFFLNKISGFNPDKSNEPTTLELIKLP
jgi:hypothetical protein